MSGSGGLKSPSRVQGQSGGFGERSPPEAEVFVFSKQFFQTLPFYLNLFTGEFW